MSKAFNIIQRGSLSILAINNGSIVYRAKTESMNKINPDFGDLVVNDYSISTIEQGIVLGAAPKESGYIVTVLPIDANGEPLPVQPIEFKISVDSNKLAKDIWCDDQGIVLALRDKINSINNRQLQKLQESAKNVLAYIEKVKMAEAITLGVSSPTIQDTDTCTNHQEEKVDEAKKEQSIKFASNLSKEAEKSN